MIREQLQEEGVSSYGSKEVTIVISVAVRSLCVSPYYNHPKGCPNFDKKKGCPPQAPLIYNTLNLRRPIFVIWNIFPLGEHVARMKVAHADWSEPQLRCCLYWQSKARKQLKEAIDSFLELHSDLTIVTCPEAQGVDVTATMHSIGIQLDWPPQERAIQVAVAGCPNLRYIDRMVVSSKRSSR